ncbi:thiamine phosphate synthase [Rhodanobacter sp. AS-Z3]|uniref:thiamine phosphate synthase n=1 Tax=Rhodanobacter sp. AS-Z3 TaxID=3031330 RepID=UPI002478731A|nr:thiamine phosphate synthase [Rhodanobacter sp. AS-Z3]WEN15918.1 thiamine phosphate synthase [Rhodanobacter sp. AS-Z3]
MTALPAFYPIVDSADWVARLMPLGIGWVQLRIKQQPVDIVRREVRAALAMCRVQAVTLVVNDHWQIALDEGAEFIHLGQQDLLDADIRAIRTGGIKFGISTHDHHELNAALALDPDYVALGPVYHTTLKHMPWAPQGLSRISEWKRRVGDRPLVAIGGITLERAPGCFDAGADCVAVVSDVTRHADPCARVCDWVAATRVPS